MTINDNTDDARYAAWKDASMKAYLDAQERNPGSPIGYSVYALSKAGTLFRKEKAPKCVYDELQQLLKSTSWLEQKGVQWFGMHNMVKGFLNKSKPLMRVARDSGLTARMALHFAIYIDRCDKSYNSNELYESLRVWENRVPDSLTNVNTAVGELIRVLGGDDRAEQWITLLTLDKTDNKGALNLLAITDENAFSILDFALKGTPLRSQSVPTVQTTEITFF